MPVHRGLRCGLTEHKTRYSLLVAYSDTCPSLDNPTLADLVHDVRRDHDRSCACGSQIGPKVWLARSFHRWTSTVGMDLSLLEEYDMHTPLDQFSNHIDAKQLGTIHIFIQSVPPQHPIRRTLEEPPKVFTHLSATALCIAGAEPRLPTDAYVPYADMCKTPGLLLVDKSRFVSPHHTQPEGWRLPLIRRPKGFGKTTFLSLLEAYVDIDRNDALFPFENYLLPVDLQCLRGQGLLLVFHLDFADLKVFSNTPESLARTACRDLLTRASTVCYGRYRDRLHYDEDKETFARVSFPQLVNVAREQGRSLFVGIDNYTAPLATSGECLWLEDIITQEIFDPIFLVWPSDVICRGLMVGDDDLPGPTFWPYSASEHFSEYTIELTHEPIAHEILGLTEDEIMVLGRALFRQDLVFLQQVRQRARVPAEEMQDGPCLGRMYSICDVLAFAGALRASPNKAAAAGSAIKSVTYDDYLPPTRYLPPGMLAKAVEIWKREFIGRPEPTTPPQEAVGLELAAKLKAKPRKSDPVSDDGSTDSSTGSLPPLSHRSDSSSDECNGKHAS